MSTTTLLQAGNEVLRSIGERPLLQLSGTTADRLRDVFRQALRDVEALHTWDWLYAQIPAISWSQDEAYLGDIQRLFTVSVGDKTNGYRELMWVDFTDYDQQPITSYTGTSDNARTYTMTSNGRVKLNPYPSDSTAQARVRFYVLQTLTLPTSDDGVFALIPERYMPLLVKRASYLMALRHLDDTATAAYFNNEYEILTQQYRNNERKVPVQQLNMYRRRRR